MALRRRVRSRASDIRRARNPLHTDTQHHDNVNSTTPKLQDVLRSLQAAGTLLGASRHSCLAAARAPPAFGKPSGACFQATCRAAQAHPTASPAVFDIDGVLIQGRHTLPQAQR